jgi:hypothetical protein
MKKPIFSLFILALMLLAGVSADAQRVSKVNALKGFEGNARGWGIERNGIVKPARGYSFFEVDKSLIIFLKGDNITANQVAATIRKSKSFQLAIFGESYTTFKKKKKKKKPKPTIKVVCKSKSGCNGSCYAILDGDGQFIRCGGSCCEDGEGVWGSSNVGTALETVGMY